MIDLAEFLTTEVEAAIQEASATTERSLQAADFYLGMSDIGHCREYARRIIMQIPPSDERDKTAAFIGTVLGDGVEQALKKRYPDWIIQTEVVTTLPSGTQIVGHPDVIIPDLNVVVDLKTKNGLEVVKKEGHTTQQRFQKHGYAAGAIEAGLVNPDGLMVANVFIDRSGATATPYVIVEPYDPGVLEEIDAWLEDVFYAVSNGEEASKDKPRDWCERFCEQFTNCRLYDTDVAGLIEAEEHVAAVLTYAEGQALVSEGKRKMNQAKAALTGVAGATPTHILRWTWVNPTEIAGFTRAGYDKIDLRPRKDTP